MKKVMPIDGIMLSSYSGYLRQRIESSPHLAETISHHTAVKSGENFVTANYNDLKFKICSSGRVEIKGSLHKYFNCIKCDFIGKQRHNANDFNTADIKSALTSLARDFGPDILECKVDSIEFGLNISTPWPARNFIEKNITLLRSGVRLKNPIIDNSIHGFTSGLKYIFCDYWLKVYDKGQQFNTDDDLLRCEYKALKMRAIKAANIKILNDITDLNSLQIIFNNLVDVYNNLLIREEFNERDFSEHDLRLYDQCFNPDYWSSLDRQERNRKKKQFDKLYTDHGTTDFKGDLLKLLESKFYELT